MWPEDDGEWWKLQLFFRSLVVVAVGSFTNYGVSIFFSDDLQWPKGDTSWLIHATNFVFCREFFSLKWGFVALYWKILFPFYISMIWFYQTHHSGKFLAVSAGGFQKLKFEASWVRNWPELNNHSLWANHFYFTVLLLIVSYTCDFMALPHSHGLLYVRC